jgi:hypothetical protein
MNAPTPVRILCLASAALNRFLLPLLAGLAPAVLPVTGVRRSLTPVFGDGAAPEPATGPDAGAMSSTHSCQPGGGAGHCGEGRHPGEGTQPGGGAGQFGGGLNRYAIPISQPATAIPDSSPPSDRGPWHPVIMQPDSEVPQRNAITNPGFGARLALQPEPHPRNVGYTWDKRLMMDVMSGSQAIGNLSRAGL